MSSNTNDFTYNPPAYDPPIASSSSAPYPQPTSRPVPRQRKSIMDELIPLPSQTNTQTKGPSPLIPLNVLRRTGSVAVIVVFLLSTVYLATTEPVHRRTGLRAIFGVGSDAGIGGAGWVAQDLSHAVGGNVDAEKSIDYDQYIKMRTIAHDDAEMSDGKRMIFIGDIHGSFDPLQRLLTAINFDLDGDKIIHVGDLIAKGDKNVEVLEWMDEFNVHGVRGNHDQPVIRWRAWMEWAGGSDWEDYVDNLDAAGEGGLIHALQAEGKQYPKNWKWKGEHWIIARHMKANHYKYLLGLPLTLHIPSLHTFVVHAGLLPFDPTKSLTDTTQPLNAAAHSSISDLSTSRISEELSILLGVRQNTDPYTLIEMRSVYTHGKKKGKVTKNAKKGQPWSDVWNKQMKRCTRLSSEEVEEEKGEVDVIDDDIADGLNLNCSPVNVVYGHAAGRGLDIKKHSKGIDTGCVYGRQLTALILGDTTGLKGPTVHLAGHKGVLVSIDCGTGGT